LPNGWIARILRVVAEPHAESDRPRTETVLEERVRIVCHTAFDAMVMVDDSRRYVCVNDSAADLLGAPAEVILGLRIDRFAPSDRVAKIEPMWAHLRRGGMVEGRGPMLRYDGSRCMVDYRGRWNFAPNLHLFTIREVKSPALQPDLVASRPIPQLTPREREVLQLSADGGSTEEIAAQLGLSSGTIKTHFQHIYDKLDAGDRVAAVATALRLGLIS
jgi:PAS domain S-box-containing protein